jgi:hypothetical protein
MIVKRWFRSGLDWVEKERDIPMDYPEQKIFFANANYVPKKASIRDIEFLMEGSSVTPDEIERLRC